ncbi:MAG: S-layer homology domain-containing protein, partial [Oscillospiraceae bacterium]|nr:S-layer homology domain-containing protein [Oscillospiraceae bacterium]
DGYIVEFRLPFRGGAEAGMMAGLDIIINDVDPPNGANRRMTSWSDTEDSGYGSSENWGKIELVNTLQYVAVTFDANGGTGTMTPASVLKYGSYTLPANGFTQDGYTFAGWRVNGVAPTLAAGAQVTLDAAITLNAQWTAITPDETEEPEESTPPSGDTTPPQTSAIPPSTTTTPSTSATTIPGMGGDDVIEIPATIDNTTGAVTLKLDDDKLDALITDALAKSEEEEEPAEVTLDLTGVDNATSAVLDVNAAQAFADADVAVTVKLPGAEVTLGPDALAELAAESDIGTTPITVEAAVVPMSELKGMQAAQVKGYETVVSIDVFVGAAKVDIPITVSLPYKLKPNEDPEGVCVWYMDDSGRLTKLNGVYNAETGMITFIINHQSYFVVGYDPVTMWVNVFGDVSPADWFYDDVAYVSYYSYVDGDGKGNFMPRGITTRAMLVTLLWNIEGKPEHEGGVSFDDVAPGTYYHDAVIWAAENGIVQGDGKGGYDPNGAITRQGMATMLLNYADFKGYDIPENRSLPSFTDYSQIDIWAETAAKKLSEAGVMSGYDGAFVPHKDATRAELSGLLKNFLRLVVGAQ